MIDSTKPTSLLKRDISTQANEDIHPALPLSIEKQVIDKPPQENRSLPLENASNLIEISLLPSSNDILPFIIDPQMSGGTCSSSAVTTVENTQNSFETQCKQYRAMHHEKFRNKCNNTKQHSFKKSNNRLCFPNKKSKKQDDHRLTSSRQRQYQMRKKNKQRSNPKPLATKEVSQQDQKIFDPTNPTNQRFRVNPHFQGHYTNHYPPPRLETQIEWKKYLEFVHQMTKASMHSQNQHIPSEGGLSACLSN